MCITLNQNLLDVPLSKGHNAMKEAIKNAHYNNIDCKVSSKLSFYQDLSWQLNHKTFSPLQEDSNTLPYRG